MQETVSLPDPAVQLMVHPDDVPAARGLWRRAWVSSLVGSGGVLFLIGAVAWALTSSWLPPTAAVLSVGTGAWLSQRHLAGAAWDHIPQRRQDRERPESVRRRVGAHLVDAVALAGGAVVLAAWAGRTGQGHGLRTWFLSAGAVLVLLVAARALLLARRSAGKAARTTGSTTDRMTP